MRAESAGFQIVRCHRIARIFHSPGRQHVMAEEPVLISRNMTECAIVGQIHGLYLLRKIVRNQPSCQSQIGTSPISHIAGPGKPANPIYHAFSVRPLVYIGFPFTFRTAASPAILINISKPSSAILPRRGTVYVIIVGIAGPHYDYRNLPLQFRPVNDRPQRNAILHRQHDFFLMDLFTHHGMSALCELPFYSFQLKLFLL